MTGEKLGFEQQTIALARKLERLLMQRRAQNKKLALLDHHIKTTRKFLTDVSRPFALEGGPALPGENSTPRKRTPRRRRRVKVTK